MATSGKTPGLTLSERIAADFRDRIHSGALQPGDRLPTLREVASEVDVHRSTVQQAYRSLADEGLVESVVGRGTVVLSPQAARSAAGPSGASVLSPAAQAALQALDSVSRSSPAGAGDLAPVTADMASLHPDPSSFPADDLRRAIDQVLGEGDAALGYGETSGSVALRGLLADRSGLTADQVLVTNGAQQGIELVVRAFVEPGRGVAVAVPTYPQLFGVLASQGVGLVPIQSPDGLLDLDALRRCLHEQDVALLYVMPSFHNPTGVSLDDRQRRALVDVVAETNVPILEDEYERDLRTGGSEVPTLASLDPRGLTVTVRTVSKALFPGLRLGWVETSPELIAPLRALKRFGDIETSGFLQSVLAALLQQGAIDRHLDRSRDELQSRQRAARASLEQFGPKALRISAGTTGPTLWLHLPGCDADRVARRAAETGVAIVPGRMFDPSGACDDRVRLSLARITEDDIPSAIERLCAVLHEELRVPHSHPLIL